MNRLPLPPELERRALSLVDDLVETAEDPDSIDTMLAREDPRVRARVHRLLGCARTAGETLPTIVTGAEPEDLPIPERIGVFRLVEEIGSGGMGAVWRGVRDDGLFEQVVAIKLLRAAPVLLGGRFAEERRILARLDHPNIARLIDGGVVDGVPYLVMEYVPGSHLDAAAEALPLGERVSLFLAVAQAVQFAHARLVVHADLKPSNIVVGADGRVKLLDFGVARLISDDTGGAAHPMTPAYASPVRREGKAPLIADDVFALGRILHGLIAEAEDPDLRAIAAKAVAIEEVRRYPAVGDLIADLGRWRDRLPVVARAPTWRYRAGRFVTRHRIGVAATTVALILLSITSVIAILSARAAERQRAVAERRFDDVRALSRFMLTDLYDELGNAPGTVVPRVRIAAVAGRYLDRLGRNPEAPRALRLEIAQGYERLARVQGVSGVASLGKPSEALASLNRAEAMTRTLLADRQDDAAAQELAGSIALDRWTLAPENASSSALNAVARAAFVKALAIDPTRQGALIGLLLTEKNRAFELIWTDDRPKDAIPVLETALARLDRAGIDAAHRDDAQQLRVNLLNRLGDALYYSGDLDGSLATFRVAQGVIRGELAKRETLAWLERRGESYWYVSGGLEDRDVPAALASARAGVRTMQRVLSYGPDSNAEKWLAILYNQEASLLTAMKDYAAATRPALLSVAIRERRAAGQPDDPRRARDLAIGLASAADIFGKAGRKGDSCELARRSVASWNAIERRGRLGKMDAKKSYPKARASMSAMCGDKAPPTA